MKTFDYVRPATIADAVAAAAEPGAAYLGAGTNLLDLMKGGVTRPNRLVDITRLPGLDRIERMPDGGVADRRAGPQCRSRARSRNSPDPIPPWPRRCCPARRRNYATPRPSAAISCSGRDAPISTTPPAPATNANPGSGCDARVGENRLHAVLGWSEACIATHPSDFCVPLVALDAVVEIEGRTGRREIALEDLHRLPGDDARTRKPSLSPAI